LQKKLVTLECHSRRDNLIFSGIEEVENESKQQCEDALMKILHGAGLGHITFERVHRLGFKKDQKDLKRDKNASKDQKQSRHIIAKFSSYKDRELVWSRRFNISETQNIWIMQDFPEEIKTRRQTLMPALKAALRSPIVNKASLQVDKLIVDSKVYTVESMNQLPAFLQPDKTSIIETDKTVVFFTKHAIFSNLNPLPVRLDGRLFSCNEQYFQYMKALHFNDQQVANRILEEKDPYKMMSLAREIAGYKHSEWQQQAGRILKVANEAKYRQHEVAKEALLATCDKKLGEASSNSFYGTGVGLLSSFASDDTKWFGKNLMGTILTEIRDSFQ
jgi:ribA/ribD-fused uncharacterized protein